LSIKLANYSDYAEMHGQQNIKICSLNVVLQEIMMIMMRMMMIRILNRRTNSQKFHIPTILYLIIQLLQFEPTNAHNFVKSAIISAAQLCAPC